MGGAERVVLAFGTTREAAEAAALANGANTVAPAGEDLVRISLVANVPYQTVARRVEHRVQRDRQLDHPERRAEVAAGDGNRVDGLGAQLVGKLIQLVDGQVAQIGGMPHPVEEWSLGRDVHGRSFTAHTCLGVPGAHLKRQPRDILPPLCAAAGLIARTRVVRRTILATTAKACARRDSIGQSGASANVVNIGHGRSAPMTLYLPGQVVLPPWQCGLCRTLQRFEE